MLKPQQPSTTSLHLLRLLRLAGHRDQVDAVPVARAVGQIVPEMRAVDADALAAANSCDRGFVSVCARAGGKRRRRSGTREWRRSMRMGEVAEAVCVFDTELRTSAECERSPS